MTQQHGPWKYQIERGSDGVMHTITDSRDFLVYAAHDSSHNADSAAFIVRACNSHDALLAALTTALNDKPTGAAYLVWESEARAAIAQAKGE